MKKISVLIPCYNEEENVVPISEAVIGIITKELPQYDYELVFIDNDSTDKTRELLRMLCAKNPKIKAIFNARNFGQFNSPYYGILQVTGDCVISMVADFQDPVELIPKYVHEWENGYKIVIGIKTSSKENPVMYWLRSCYYKLIRKLSDVEQIEHFTGSGLYDRQFIEVLRNLNDPTPFLRGIVAELGFKRKEIPYEQPKRRAGKTHNNFYKLYDAAMLSFTSYTKAGLRLATFFRRLLRWRELYRSSHISDHETLILGPLYGRYGAASHRNVFSWICPDLLYRPAWRVYHEHQYPCDAPPARCGGGAHQF